MVPHFRQLQYPLLLPVHLQIMVKIRIKSSVKWKNGNFIHNCNNLVWINANVLLLADINKKNDPYQPALIELNLGYAKTKLTEVIVARSPNGSPKTISSTLIQAKKIRYAI